MLYWFVDLKNPTITYLFGCDAIAESAVDMERGYRLQWIQKS